MPYLKYIIENSDTTELKMLRGKAIECVSLIGLAVGAEKVSGYHPNGNIPSLLLNYVLL